MNRLTRNLDGLNASVGLVPAPLLRGLVERLPACCEVESVNAQGLSGFVPEAGPGGVALNWRVDGCGLVAVWPVDEAGDPFDRAPEASLAFAREVAGLIAAAL